MLETGLSGTSQPDQLNQQLNFISLPKEFDNKNITLGIWGSAESDTATGLEPYRKDIEMKGIEALRKISAVMQIHDLDIVIYDTPLHIIPEEGMGGQADGLKNLAMIFFNTQLPDIITTTAIHKYMLRTVAHEVNHVMRMRVVGLPSTLFKAFILEGLAQHFAEEIDPGDHPLYAVAINDPVEIHALLRKAQSEFDVEFTEEDFKGNGRYRKWFYGKVPTEIPRWAGYSLGYQIVGEYLKDHQEAKPSTIFDQPEDDFRSYVDKILASTE